jgi:hypothetical protein
MTVLLRDDAGVLHPVLINVPAEQIRDLIEKAETCGRQLEERFRIEPLPIMRAS